jgi:diguanylate cyclase (GGDEF)-like protein
MGSSQLRPGQEGSTVTDETDSRSVWGSLLPSPSTTLLNSMLDSPRADSESASSAQGSRLPGEGLLGANALKEPSGSDKPLADAELRKSKIRRNSRQQFESSIRLAGWKGRSGGTRSEAEMGPASKKEFPIRLAGRKGRSGGTRSEAEMGPASKKDSKLVGNSKLRASKSQTGRKAEVRSVAISPGFPSQFVPKRAFLSRFISFRARKKIHFASLALLFLSGVGVAAVAGLRLSSFVNGVSPAQVLHHQMHDLSIEDGKFNRARLQALSTDPFDLDTLHRQARNASEQGQLTLKKIARTKQFAAQAAVVDQALRDQVIDMEQFFAAAQSGDFDTAMRMAASTGKWRAENLETAKDKLDRAIDGLPKPSPTLDLFALGAGLLTAAFAASSLARRLVNAQTLTPGLDAMLRATADAHVALDGDGRIVAASHSVRVLTDREPSQLLGEHSHTLVPLSEREALEQARLMATSTGKMQVLTIEIVNAGARRQFRASVVKVEGWDGVVMIFAERTAENALETELITKAFHDSLTGLANRSLFRTRVQTAIDNRKRIDGIVTVLFLDLDGFKNINDSLGHDAGDELIKEVAFRLTTLLRPGDTLARLGGDEFGLLLVDPRPKFGQLIAERILGVTSQPIRLHHRQVSVGVSIGLAEARNGDSVEDLLRNADTAMYAAKENGKNRVEQFRTEMFTEAVKRLEIDADLRLAVDAGQLQLHYQPVIDLQTGEMHSVEALMRWKHPVRGMVPPSVFIPIAEESGSIVELGRWALQTAIAFAATLPNTRQTPSGPERNVKGDGIGRDSSKVVPRPDSPKIVPSPDSPKIVPSPDSPKIVPSPDAEQGRLGVRVNVNLSARQLDDASLVELIAHELALHKVDPQRLVLEVTESVVVNQIDQAVSRLNEFKSLGCGLALDDFGTGYSSLSHLKRMPIDILKIDRAFVTDIGQVSDDSFIQAIIDLGKTLGMKTVAEGIETQQQLDWLRGAGCSSGQGFYLAKPMSDSDLRLAFVGEHEPA